jgi:hypothetical protein
LCKEKLFQCEFVDHSKGDTTLQNKPAILVTEKAKTQENIGITKKQELKALKS